MTLDYAAARPAVTQSEVPTFGLLVMVTLALASAAIGLSNPETFTAGYETAVVLAGA
jgi:hypothetical protein